MEQEGLINKDQFDKVSNAINRARKIGLLPVDFVAEEDSRAFSGVVTPTDGDLSQTLNWMLRDVMSGHKFFIPNYWKDEEYYIQVVVEKIDLKTLFSPVCSDFNIPIANSKGWSSILQRAEYCRRFRKAENEGLKCVLLYCGDHDPDGLRISDTLRKNLEQISEIYWSGGMTGYDPSDLIIDRFGLNYDFIVDNDYTWIDNLITGSKKKLDLSMKSHPNHKLPYVQKYLKNVGARKCEANAIVTTPEKAETLMIETIEKYLGEDARERFKEKEKEVMYEYFQEVKESGIIKSLRNLLDEDRFFDYDIFLDNH